MQALAEKVFFITGAAGGVGYALARAFGSAGMRLALTDIDARRLDAAATQLRTDGHTVYATPLDVTDFNDWQRAADAVESALGPVAVLCNNAGIGIGTALHLDDPDRWRTVLEVNALGPFYGCRTFAPRMLAAGDESHIVNIASLSGLRANAGTSSYNASKHAMVGMTDAIAQQVVAAVQANEYHVFTHCDHKADLAALYAERLDAFRGNADPEYHEDLNALRAAFEASKGR